jgi:hypothetical protein
MAPEAGFELPRCTASGKVAWPTKVMADNEVIRAWLSSGNQLMAYVCRQVDPPHWHTGHAYKQFVDPRRRAKGSKPR